MKTIRVDTGKTYHSQRNNLTRPNITCASTSMAMALRYAGYGEQMDKFIPQKMQDEDYITDFIHTNPAVLDFWEHHPYRWIKDAYKNYRLWEKNQLDIKHVIFGNEIHEVMSFAINTMLHAQVCSYADKMSLRTIVRNVAFGGSATLSGTFPYKDKTIRHIVCLAGFTTKQDDADFAVEDEIDLSQIENFIIDDPYGDYRTAYASTNGNDIVLPLEDVYALLNEQGNTLVKRAILVKKFS